MPWIIFALLTPSLFGISNFIDKFLVEKRIKSKSALLITIFMGLVSFLLGIIILTFKGFPLFSPIQILLVLISGIFLNFYLFPYFKALTLDDASRIVPFFSFIPIFILILSYVFLGEKLTSRELIGFMIVISGSFILGAEKIHKGIFTLRKSLWLMIISSFMYALSSILFKSILLTQDLLVTFGYQSIGIGIGSFFILFYSPIRNLFVSEAKKFKVDTWTLLSLNESLAVTAQFSYSYAFTLAPTALVSVIGSAQPFFVLIYGLFLSAFFPHIVREEVDKATIYTKAFSILLIFLGIYFIYT